MEQTLVLIKPDGVRRGLVGELIHRFERMGLKIVALKMVRPSEKMLQEHYKSSDDVTLQRWGEKTLKTYQKYGKDAKKDLGTDNPLELGKMVRKWLFDYVTSGPIIAILLEGKHSVENVVNMAGPSMPAQAGGGTIRGDYLTDSAGYAKVEKRAG